MIIEVEYLLKNLCFRDDKHRLHRVDGPAVIDRDGDIHSYIDNIFIGWGHEGAGRRQLIVSSAKFVKQSNLENFRHHQKEGELIRQYAQRYRDRELQQKGRSINGI